MRVELDVFSGQSNPAWELTPGEVAEVAKRLTGLPRLQQAAGEPGLGYRGFVLSNPQRFPDLPIEIRVYGGVLTIREPAGPSYYRDAAKLEDWLLVQARQAGQAEILREIGK